MLKPSPLLCLAVIALGLAGCSKGSNTQDIGDTKTREAEARDKMQNAFANDPSLQKPGSAPNAAAVPHAAPPGAPMGSAH